jgi:hypothetical protein
MIEKPKKLDGGLNFWLMLTLLGNAVFVLGNAIFLVSQIETDMFFPLGGLLSLFVNAFLLGGSPLWSIPLFITYSLVSICSIIALYMWRKWGFYAICLTTIAGFVTCFGTGILPFGVLVGCASTVILAILLRTEWSRFR